MALRMSRHDDLTGEEDAETVTIVVNGRGIEIDLAERSMAKLNKALEPFWSVATEARYSVTKGGTVKKVRPQSNGNQSQDAAVRAWAVENGIEVTTRGRVAKEIVDQYKAAQ